MLNPCQALAAYGLWSAAGDAERIAMRRKRNSPDVSNQ
jgi:hypothetical protein